MVYLWITHLLGCQNRLHTKWFSSLDTWNRYAKIKENNNWKWHPQSHQNQLPLARKHPYAFMFSIRLILTQINIQIKSIALPLFFSSSRFFSYCSFIDNMHDIDSPNSWFSMELPVRAGYPAILAPSDVHRLQSRRPSDQSDYKYQKKNLFYLYKLSP